MAPKFDTPSPEPAAPGSVRTGLRTDEVRIAETVLGAFALHLGYGSIPVDADRAAQPSTRRP